MENTSADKQPRLAQRRLLFAASLLVSSSALAGEGLLLLRQGDSLPSSPLLAHGTEGRFFSGHLARSGEFYKETNDGSSAEFTHDQTAAGIRYDRAVSPSVGLALGVSWLQAGSSYSSVHQGLTANRERALTSSGLIADTTFKIMDTIVLGLRLGSQLNKLTFDAGSEEAVSAWTIGPGLAFKARGFELALFHQSRLLRQKNDEGQSVVRRYGESTIMLTGHEAGLFNWTLWYQRNPLPACCAFTDRGRDVYGGALFLRQSAWTLMPGYRYLAEFREDRNPGSIEDVARHHVFAHASRAVDGGVPAFGAGYEFPATKKGPASFSDASSTRSNVSAGRWTLAGSWGLAF